MKTKVGGLDIDKDVERVKAIREAIGPNIRLMIDERGLQCRYKDTNRRKTIRS